MADSDPQLPPPPVPAPQRVPRKADFVALSNLRYELRKFLAFSEAAAAANGLTPQQHQVLLAIKGSPDDRLTVGEIAERMLLRHHSAGELVGRLERMGLVAREHDTRDRRRVNIRVTALAEQRLRYLSGAHLDELSATGPLLRTLLDHFVNRD
ncbi:helix-turn-helix domain-containing protein [Orrella sp. JC864]|uniref:MarR family winged helix-turn-helix transcriptional regulator n=1 Tax=Orrella sp. JC864 TaxID=3120298 RepID=UPI0012BCB2C2